MVWTINIIFMAVLVVIALIGAVLGFGRSLKLSTKGIFGIILSIVFCVMFGAALLATPVVGDWVARGDEYFRGIWNFLGVIHLATVLYFIALFLFFQIVRIIIVRVLKTIAEIDNGVMKVFNKIGGSLYLAAFAFFIFLLVLAIIDLPLFADSDFVKNFIEYFEGSFIGALFEHNPIVFGQ